MNFYNTKKNKTEKNCVVIFLEIRTKLKKNRKNGFTKKNSNEFL
jgi:hypothetical protein